MDRELLRQALTKFFAGLAMRKEEGFRRLGSHHPEVLQKRDNLLATAINPDIDVTALPDKRIGIQPGIGRPLQDGGPPPLLLEKFRKMRRLGINQAVMPADSLGFARPLEGEVQRRLPVLREFADALFSGLYFKMCIILLGRTECEPKKGEKSFLQTRNQGLSQRVLIVRSEAERAMGAVISFTRIFKQIHPASKLHDFHFRFSVFFSFFHKFLHLVTLDKLYIHAITQQVCRIIQFNDLHFRCYVFLFFVHNYRTITCLPLK